MGGTGGDIANAITIHPTSGEVYVAGSTSPGDLPGAADGAQSGKAAGTDAFVSRFNAALTSCLQTTYLGGNAEDAAQALSIHPTTGELYIAGVTLSSDLPGDGGGAQAAKSAGNDAFVTRFNAALTLRLQSSYLGSGGSGDIALAMAIHPFTGEPDAGPCDAGFHRDIGHQRRDCRNTATQHLAVDS